MKKTILTAAIALFGITAANAQSETPRTEDHAGGSATATFVDMIDLTPEPVSGLNATWSTWSSYDNGMDLSPSGGYQFGISSTRKFKIQAKASDFTQTSGGGAASINNARLSADVLSNSGGILGIVVTPISAFTTTYQDLMSSTGGCHNETFNVKLHFQPTYADNAGGVYNSTVDFNATMY